MKGKKASMAIALIGMSKRILIACALALLSFQAVNANEWWKDGWFWMGTKLGPSFNVGGNGGESWEIDSVGGATFNMAASFGLQLAKAFAFQFEFMFDRGVITAQRNFSNDVGSGETKHTISYSSLTIPIFAKLTFRPGICSIGIFAGPCFTLPIGDADWEVVHIKKES